jgi:hypothetical protein
MGAPRMEGRMERKAAVIVRLDEKCMMMISADVIDLEEDNEVESSSKVSKGDVVQNVV